MRRPGSTRAPSGQTATEYMLVISVIVCSVVAAAYLFVPEFQNGVAQLAQDVSVALATGQVGGIGFARHGGGGGAAPGSAVAPGQANPGNGSGINPGSATANSDVVGNPSTAAAPLGRPEPPTTIGSGPVTAAHALDVKKSGPVGFQ